MDIDAEEEQPAGQKPEHRQHLWQYLWECSYAGGEHSEEYLLTKPLGFDKPS